MATDREQDSPDPGLRGVPGSPHGLVPRGEARARRRPTAVWLISLSEPLIDTSTRASIDEDFAAFADSYSHWVHVWFSGLLYELMATLPAQDPWRHLSTRTALSNRHNVDSVILRGTPSGEGTFFPSGQAAGTPGDSDDLLVPELGDRSTDIGLAGLVGTPSPLTLTLIAMAGDTDPTRLVSAFAMVHEHLRATADDPGQVAADFLQVAGDAVRRVLHRRRIYVGIDDSFATITGYSWMARADRVVGGTRELVDEVGLWRDGAIENDVYAELKV